MEEIQIKTKYPDFLNGGYMAINFFANLINNESVILYFKQKDECAVVYQKEYDDIKYFRISQKDFYYTLIHEKITLALSQLNLPTKYTIVKAKPNYSNIFVSDINNRGVDISLMENKEDLEWEIKSSNYPKALKNDNIIRLGGKEKE